MRSNRKLLGAVLALLCLAGVISATAVGESGRDIAKGVLPSVVLLVMEDSNGQPLTMGSGFVIREGLLATNLHVIEGAARGYAKVVGEKAKYVVRGAVGSDPERDLVLLAVDDLKTKPLSIGDSDQVAVGDVVYAVGNPRGLEGTFSTGIVSSVRKIGEDSLLQITAPISPGSSGGPVLNSKGEVVGVAVATFKEGQNLNFAIPSRYLSALIPSMKAAVPLSEAVKALQEKQKTILDGLGGRSTEGVVGSQFLWANQLYELNGDFSLTFRNQLREPVRNINCLVIFYDKQNAPLDIAVCEYRATIPPGLAKRVQGKVDASVKRLTTPVSTNNPYMSAFTPDTRVEFRILYFDIVTGDERAD